MSSEIGGTTVGIYCDKCHQDSIYLISPGLEEGSCIYCEHTLSSKIIYSRFEKRLLDN